MQTFHTQFNLFTSFYLGFLSKLSTRQLTILLKSLEDSYEIACSFDLRPGLKFLVQKVAQTNVAANLYKQAGVSWTIHMVVLFELCMSHSPLTLEHVKEVLSSENDLHNFKESKQNICSLCCIANRPLVTEVLSFHVNFFA